MKMYNIVQEPVSDFSFRLQKFRVPQISGIFLRYDLIDSDHIAFMFKATTGGLHTCLDTVTVTMNYYRYSFDTLITTVSRIIGELHIAKGFSGL